jgi:hypothetical protein
MGESNFRVRLWPETGIVKIGLIVLFFVTVVKNGILIGLVPLWQGPDEPVHFSYVQFLAEEKSIPRYAFPFRSYHTDMSEELRRSLDSLDAKFVSFQTLHIQRFLYREGWEFGGSGSPLDRRVNPDHYRNAALSYSPLYYLYGALFYSLTYQQSIENRTYAVRFGTSLLMIPFLLFSFGFARLLLENEPAALSLTAFVSFQPMVSFVFSIVNNDAFLITACSAAFYFIAGFLIRNSSQTLFAGALSVGIACLAKTQGFFLLLLWPVFTAVGMFRAGKFEGLKFISGAVLIGLIIIPWAVFCYINYDSFFGPSFYNLAGAESKYEEPTFLSRFLPLFFRWPFTLFVSFWGNFGYLDTQIHDGVAKILWWIYILFFVIFCLFLIKNMI